MMSDVAWRPDALIAERAQITAYLDWLTGARGLRFGSYIDAWRWSVDDLDGFWDSWWQYADPVGDRRGAPALVEETMPGTVWFPGARLSYAENLLRHSERDRPAIIAIAEDEPPVEVSWAQLARDAGALSATLRELGVARGDRVVAYVDNIPEAVVGLIATASLGAVWSVCSPDFGTAGVIARFRQLRPKVLLGVNGYRFNGTVRSRAREVHEIAGGLADLRHMILIDVLGSGGTSSIGTTSWSDAVATPAALSFERVAFDHPLWVLYSSGTTGSPKGIVHGHGGILLEHLKHQRLGLDLGPQDRLLLLASTSWMVWNALVSGLLTGTSIVLLSGNPVGADMRRVWRVIEQARVTVLGVGASFLHSSIKAGLSPGRQHDLSSLREIMSTGSPLAPDAYRWVGEAVGERVWINSSSGGTDICSAFVGGCPLLPVRAGRLQAPQLGVAVAAWDENAEPVIGRSGELVVTKPMPSMPLYLWDDADGTRLHDSYFATYPGIWRHGDFIEFDADGSSVIHGRSDSTLNRNGIRMGSAELYAIVESLPEVTEAMVVGVEEGGGYFMPLFVTLAPGVAEADARERIVAAIRDSLSARHVPDEIVAAPGIPHTKTGKKLEVPVKRLLQGQALDSVLDPASVDVPPLLDYYVAFARAHLAGAREAPA